MKDASETKEQPINELAKMRQRIAELEALEVERKRAEEARRESEEKYRDLVENISDVIYATDQNGTITYISPIVESFIGYRPSEFIGRPFTKFIYQEDLPRITEKFQSVILGHAESNEYRFLTKSGEIRWMRTSSRPIQAGNRVIGSRGVLADITARKQMEEALHREQEMLRSILVSMADEVSVVDTDFTIQMVNEEKVRKQGDASRPDSGLIGRKCFEAYERRDQVCPDCPIQEAFRTGEPVRGSIHTGFTNTGQPYIAEVSAAPVRDASGKIVAGVEMVRDITARKRAEEALRESEARYRSLFEDSSISLWQEDFSAVKTYLDSLRASGVKDFRTYFENHPEAVAHCVAMVKVVDVNQTTLELYKASSKEELQSGLDTIFSEETYLSFKEELICIAEGIRRFENETTVRTLTNDKLHIALRWSAAPGYEDTLSKVFVSIIDITGRQALEEMWRRYEFIVNTSREFMTLINSNYTYEAINESYCKAHNKTREEIIGKTVAEIWGGERFQTAIESHLDRCFAGNEVHEQGWFEFADLGLRYIDLAYYPYYGNEGTVTHAVVVSRDITERKQAEEEIKRRSEELAALYNTALDITAQLDPQRLLHTIVKRAAELLKGYGGSMYFYRPAHDDLELVLVHNLKPDFTGAVLKRGEGLSGRVLESGQPMIVDSYSTWGERASIYEEGTFEAVIAVPMKWGEQVLGVINVLREPGVTFNGEDIRLLTLLANEAAVALENARLYKEVKDRAEELQALYATTLSITAQLERPDLLKDITRRAVELLGAEGGVIYMYDPEREELKLAVGYGYTEDYTGVTLKPGEGMAGKVFQSGEPMIVDDYRTWPGRAAVYENDQPFSAVLEVPLKWKGQVIGVLAADADVAKRTFTKDDIWLATLFANQAAIAITNARLYEESQRAYEELKAAQEQLVRAEKQEAIIELAGATAHELNQPLTVLLGLSALLRKQVSKDHPFYEDLSTIMKNAQRMSKTVKKIGQITRYETRPYVGNERIVDIDRSAE